MPAAVFRFGCVTCIVVEPPCSARRSSHVSRCISSWCHLPYIHAFSKLKFLHSCGANWRWGRESLLCTRHGIQVSPRHRSSFPKFPSWHRHLFCPHDVFFPSPFRRVRSLDCSSRRVTWNCFESCCRQLGWVSFGKVQVHQNHFHQKKIFIKIHFHQKPLSSKTTFITNQFHQKTTFIKMPLSSKTIFIKNHFHQRPLSSKTIFIKNQFHQKPISLEHFLSEGPTTRAKTM